MIALEKKLLKMPLKSYKIDLERTNTEKKEE